MTTDRRNTYYLIDITKEQVATSFEELDAWVSINSYGARCLNTKSTWFADIDFEDLFPNSKKVKHIIEIISVGGY